MKEIIISAKNGDSEAFGNLYESCRKAGLSVAKQYVKNDTDAEDMYQDAFLKAMENIDRFDENREFGPWLNTIIANTCKDFLGKKRPMNFTDMSDEETEFVDKIESSDVSSLPESVYVRKEMLQIVDGIVEMLPNEQKEATVLFYFKDFSVKQVAEYQKVSEDTVKSRLNYSRKKVEQATKDYEKKHGIKICIASVIPAILVLYFKNSAYAAQFEAALSMLSASSALTKAGIGALKVGTAAGKVAAWKIVAIVAAGAIAAIGAGFAIHHFVASGDRVKTEPINSEKPSVESEIQTENTIQEEPDEEEERLAEEEKTAVGYMNDEGYYVFGSYEQDGEESNGPEPIEWLILDENENGTLLLSRYVLDCVQFNTTKTEVSWESCSLRSWMNDDFYNAAFDDDEKASINTVIIKRNNTSDRIFALDVFEERDYFGYYDPWYSQSSFRGGLSPIAPPTKYAESKGVYTCDITDDVNINDDYWLSGETYSAHWWLRSLQSPSSSSDVMACNFTSDYGDCWQYVNREDIGVRPALYISDKLPWEPETQAENAASEKPAVVEEPEVEGPAIEGPAIVEGPATEEGVAEEKRADGFINDEGYYVFGLYEQDGDVSNGPEPIEWEILDENENGTLLISRYILDCVQYNTEDTDVTWETCSLREWMNNDFYNAAFDDEMKSRINTVTLVNEDDPRYGTPGGNDTIDNIFCLSLSEILKYYSFNFYISNQWVGYSEALIIPATKYATDNGVFTYSITDSYYKMMLSSYSEDCVGKTGASWWLRTPGEHNKRTCIVEPYGKTGVNSSPFLGHSLVVYNSADDFGVRPALYINK